MSVLIVAGVSGSGKTTVGRAVAARCGTEFVDGDDLHPAENVAKMHAGHPLTDEDREPWLDAIRARIVAALTGGRGLVVAASGLERAHRRHLLADSSPADVRIAFLDVPYATAFARAHSRHHEFFPETLVGSQFAALETPGPDEPGVRTFDGDRPVEAIVAEVSSFFCPELPEAS